ncbi:MAG: hypothetical protein IJ041_01730 [Clostridia bacterium]|nr:hypothetical protein [Clostridia bacterium]
MGIGGTIKKVVKVQAIICLVACALMLLVGFFMYAGNSEYLKYATANGGSGYYSYSYEEQGNVAYVGTQLMSWAVSIAAAVALEYLLLTGLGQLVENSDITRENSQKMLDELKKLNGSMGLMGTAAPAGEPGQQAAAVKAATLEMPDL